METTASSPMANSLAQGLTDEIRKLIIRGELPPGRPIRARDLKERFGVSHIPIREALRTLEGEGLIEYHSHRGAAPTPISLAELKELYALRRMVECDAARRSAPLYTDEHLAQLEASLLALEVAHAQDRHGDAFFTAHREFHWLLLQPYAGVYTERVVRQLWAACRRYVHMSITARPNSHAEHHREIFEAARVRDAELVASRLDDHLRITEKSLETAFTAAEAS